mgnify:CR=1 FL=1
MNALLYLQSVGTLKVTGYLRGPPLTVNRLVHIPGYGDFQMNKIVAPTDPHPLVSLKRPCSMPTMQAFTGISRNTQ